MGKHQTRFAFLPRNRRPGILHIYDLWSKPGRIGYDQWSDQGKSYLFERNLKQIFTEKWCSFLKWTWRQIQTTLWKQSVKLNSLGFPAAGFQNQLHSICTNRSHWLSSSKRSADMTSKQSTSVEFHNFSHKQSASVEFFTPPVIHDCYISVLVWHDVYITIHEIYSKLLSLT